MPIRLPQRRQSEKTAKVTGDGVWNNIKEKITKAATKNTHKDPEKRTPQIPQATSMPKEKCIPPEKHQQVIIEHWSL